MSSQNGKRRLLVNLPKGFFTAPSLEPHFRRLSSFCDVRTRSHDTVAQFEPDLAWPEAIIMWAWPVLADRELTAARDLRFIGQINTTQRAARAALARGITLSEVRRCWSPAVAELALGLALSGLRRISAHHIAMRAGDEPWVKDFPTEIDPTERQLTGRAVGIVGFGGIGQRLAELLAPFGVALQVYDPFVPAAVVERFRARAVGMDDLVRESEVVVLCAASNEGARHLLDERRIGMLRAHAVLVNVGRSMLVDMAALERRLRRGDLVAMLDVFDKEPLEAESPLRRLPNAFLSPHRAGGILESVERALAMLGDDLGAFIDGRPLSHAVTEDMLPSFSD